MSPLLHIGAVALGGACGSLARYALVNMHTALPGKFCHTAVVNLTGCLLIGIVSALIHRWELGQVWRDFLLVGCLGGYTTYSTFSLDAMQLMQEGRWHISALYILVTVVGGLCACAVGFFGTERLIKFFN